MCSGYKTNKYGFGYCNHGFVVLPICKPKSDIIEGRMTPFCSREESHVSVLPDDFDIMEYRKRLEEVNPSTKEQI
jgi:hypothetical protein